MKNNANSSNACKSQLEPFLNRFRNTLGTAASYDFMKDAHAEAKRLSDRACIYNWLIDEDPVVRGFAASIARGIRDAAAVDNLIAACRIGGKFITTSPSNEFQALSAAIEALGAVRARSAIPVLKELFRHSVSLDDEAAIAWYAMRALECIGDEDLVDLVRPLLGHEDFDVAKAARRIVENVESGRFPQDC